jgi:hypothetical protein
MSGVLCPRHSHADSVMLKPSLEHSYLTLEQFRVAPRVSALGKFVNRLMPSGAQM